MNNNPKLILSADDYGLNSSVNEGILSAVKARTITCVHVLVNMVSPNEMKRLLDTINDSGNLCGIGLHFNTTLGPAINQSATNFNHLVKGQYEFYNLYNYNHASMNCKHMYEELNAQINLLAAYVGGKSRIDAISSHHNLHFFDKRLVYIISQLSKENRIPMRSPVFWRTKAQAPKTTAYPKGLKHLFKDGIATRKRCHYPSTRNMLLTAIKGGKLVSFRNMALRKGGGAVPNNITGHWYGQPSEDALLFTIENLITLNRIKPNYCTEIYTHPAQSIEQDSPDLVYGMERRVEELKVLTSAPIISLCERLYGNAKFDFGSFRKVLQS